jgi:hypothetical protein
VDEIWLFNDAVSIEVAVYLRTAAFGEFERILEEMWLISNTT